MKKAIAIKFEIVHQEGTRKIINIGRDFYTFIHSSKNKIQYSTPSMIISRNALKQWQKNKESLANEMKLN